MNASGESFYVGYRPLPPSHRQALRIALPIAFIVVAALASLLAVSQADPGDAVWASDVEDVAGELVLAPYPMIPVEDGRRFLLVEAGKFGVPAERFDRLNDHVIARGYTLERPANASLNPSLRMLELVPDETALRPGLVSSTRGPTDAASAIERTGVRLTIRGEILDSKCFLGAMKPGQGRGHRSCAQLCIAGGIPPMLEGRDQNGSRRRLLLLGHDGNPANELVVEQAGLIAIVSGELGRLHGVDVLLVAEVTLAR